MPPSAGRREPISTRLQQGRGRFPDEPVDDAEQEAAGVSDHAVDARFYGARIYVFAQHARDAAATAAVFGFFGSAWFGWAQDSPPQAWRWALAVGSILSLLVCAASERSHLAPVV